MEEVGEGRVEEGVGRLGSRCEPWATGHRTGRDRGRVGLCLIGTPPFPVGGSETENNHGGPKPENEYV